jgi:hypothetical protein
MLEVDEALSEQIIASQSSQAINVPSTSVLKVRIKKRNTIRFNDTLSIPRKQAHSNAFSQSNLTEEPKRVAEL